MENVSVSKLLCAGLTVTASAEIHEKSEMTHFHISVI